MTSNAHCFLCKYLELLSYIGHLVYFIPNIELSGRDHSCRRCSLLCFFHRTMKPREDPDLVRRPISRNQAQAQVLSCAEPPKRGAHSPREESSEYPRPFHNLLVTSHLVFLAPCTSSICFSLRRHRFVQTITFHT